MMLKDTLERSPKGGKWLFYAIIAIFVIGAIFFVKGSGATNFPEHEVNSDIESLINGFQSIFYGDINGFFEGLVNGLPIIALFIVLFTITHFLFTKVLKDMFGQKNIATVLALVVSAYGFFDHRVYNYLLSLNAFAIGLFVFFALLIMIWGFSDKSIRRMDKDFKHQLERRKHMGGIKRGMHDDKKSIRDYRQRVKNMSSKDKEKLYEEYVERKEQGWN